MECGSQAGVEEVELSRQQKIDRGLNSIRELIEKITSYTSRYCGAGDAPIAAEDDEDAATLELNSVLAAMEQDILLTCCHEQIVYLVKHLIAEAMTSDATNRPIRKLTFYNMVNGYQHVKQAYDAFEKQKRSQVLNVEQPVTLQVVSCEEHNLDNDLIKKIDEFSRLAQNYFAADELDETAEQKVSLVQLFNCDSSCHETLKGLQDERKNHIQEIEELRRTVELTEQKLRTKHKQQHQKSIREQKHALQLRAEHKALKLTSASEREQLQLLQLANAGRSDQVKKLQSEQAVERKKSEMLLAEVAALQQRLQQAAAQELQTEKLCSQVVEMEAGRAELEKCKAADYEALLKTQLDLATARKALEEASLEKALMLENFQRTFKDNSQPKQAGEQELLSELKRSNCEFEVKLAKSRIECDIGKSETTKTKRTLIQLQKQLKELAAFRAAQRDHIYKMQSRLSSCYNQMSANMKKHKKRRKQLNVRIAKYRQGLRSSESHSLAYAQQKAKQPRISSAPASVPITGQRMELTENSKCQRTASIEQAKSVSQTTLMPEVELTSSTRLPVDGAQLLHDSSQDTPGASAADALLARTYDEIVSTTASFKAQSESLLQMLHTIEQNMSEAQDCAQSLCAAYEAEHKQANSMVLSNTSQMQYSDKPTTSSAWSGCICEIVATQRLRYMQMQTWSKHVKEFCAQSHQFRQGLASAKLTIEQTQSKYELAKICIAQQCRTHPSVQPAQEQCGTALELCEVRQQLTRLHTEVALAITSNALSDCQSLQLSTGDVQTVESSTSIGKRKKPINSINMDGKTFGCRRLDMLEWCRSHTKEYGLKLIDFSSSWSNGLAFCALIHSHRPDLLDFNELSATNAEYNLKLAESLAQQLGVNQDFQISKICGKRRPPYLRVLKCVKALHICLQKNSQS